MNMIAKTFTELRKLFHLNHDQEQAIIIDSTIRENVRVAGTNLWVLMFAIFIASIGLNINSTAVIIGAMLISPLMGPLVGMGYGAAVHDIKLVKLSLRNMAIYIVIGLLTATLYFYITPLNQAQSELLARTQPTLWDVLIAFLGGSAGIIALTRRNISNVVPGVAIATALMPPLCTAGYGLAHQKWDYFLGAFYLLSINCVFIAFATLLFSKILRLPKQGLVNSTTRLIHRVLISVMVLSLVIPSGYLAWRMVQYELFTTRVQAAVQNLQQKEGFLIVRQSLNPQKRSLNLVIAGQKHHIKTINDTLNAQISNIHIHINDIGGKEQELAHFKHELNTHLQNNVVLQQKLLERQQQNIIQELNQLKQQTTLPKPDDVFAEIQAQYPNVSAIAISKGTLWQPEQTQNTQHLLLNLFIKEHLSDEEMQRLQSWLSIRLQQNVVVIQTVTPFRLPENQK